ncbi:interleukin-27 subunit beta [Poecilia reticulata]|uniref:Epstein-Barr virus induced 3 n=1 Tax=Poecilia reticulata TaxID=8081 RepID=A0A3P9NZV1_POERE|nr:PREDICTED: interleukin-27 subunit beta [Poecilia reticulata]
MAGTVYITTILLIFGVGSQALDLLKATSVLGDPPSTPKVHCWCSSYPNVTFCSWPEPLPSHPTQYIATYSERDSNADPKTCHLVPPGSSSSALTTEPPSSLSEQLWHCHLPNLKLLTEYILNITVVHSGGSSFHLSSFMLEDIVKPDPPVDVRVSPLATKYLLVEWSPPPTWTSTDIFPLKYQILYQWEIRGSPKFNNLGPYENTKAELKGLIPGRTYQFQVCAKEMLGLGQCSDWSSPVKITIPTTKL